MSSDSWEDVDSENEISQGEDDNAPASADNETSDEEEQHITWPGKRKTPANEVSSLQNIALNCIDSYFHRFVNAYTVSKDPVLQRSLEFLQRLYSLHFICNKTEDGVLDPCYFNLLLNEHLRELDFVIFSIIDFDLVLERLTIVGHSILKASFEKIGKEDEDVKKFISKVVCCLPNVNILNIGLYCTDETLENISVHCHKLQELYIDFSDVTDTGLKNLCSNTEHTCMLKVLSCNSLDLHNVPVDFLLKNIPSLEILQHPKVALMIFAMHKNDFVNDPLKTIGSYKLTNLSLCEDDYRSGGRFNRIPLLQNLDELNANIGDIIFVCSELCPNVKTLSVEFRKAFDPMLMSRFLNLEDLTIERRNFDATFILNNFLIKSGEQLKRLNIKEHFSLSASVLVQSCPKLECVRLKSVSFELMNSADVKPLCNLQKIVLEDLDFSDSLVEDSVDYILKCSSNLEILSLQNCSLVASEMSTKFSNFFQNGSLKHIKFFKTDVEEALLQTLVLTCQTIQTIVLEYCDNISYEQIFNLHKTAETLPNYIEIIWNDDRSDENSLDNSYNDFDFYDNDYTDYSDDYDDFHGYDSDDFEQDV